VAVGQEGVQIRLSASQRVEQIRPGYSGPVCLWRRFDPAGVVSVTEGEAWIEGTTARGNGRRKAHERKGCYPAGAVRAYAILVVEEPGVGPQGDLDRLGIGEDFVVPDHAAVSGQEFRGKVSIELVGIGVFGGVPFDREVKLPELGPICCGNFRLNGPCQRERCGVGLDFFEVGNGTLGQIHFEADGGGRAGLWRLRCFGEAVEGNMLALANRTLANAGFQARTSASERTFFEEQTISGIPG
jgi:hypothetical protein